MVLSCVKKREQSINTDFEDEKRAAESKKSKKKNGRKKEQAKVQAMVFLVNHTRCTWQV